MEGEGKVLEEIKGEIRNKTHLRGVVKAHGDNLTTLGARTSSEGRTCPSLLRRTSTEKKHYLQGERTIFARGGNRR